jgi:hypothetical protein
MRCGRIVRASEDSRYSTYIVAEENPAKAEALIRTVVGPGSAVQWSVVVLSSAKGTSRFDFEPRHINRHVRLMTGVARNLRDVWLQERPIQQVTSLA